MTSKQSASLARGGVVVLLVAVLGLSGCRGGGSDPPPAAPPAPQSATYRATLLEVEIARSADGLAMPVPGLPVAGAELTR